MKLYNLKGDPLAHYRKDGSLVIFQDRETIILSEKETIALLEMVSEETNKKNGFIKRFLNQFQFGNKSTFCA